MDAVKEGWEQTVLCTECNKWCHKRCSGLRNLRGVQNLYVLDVRERGGGW